MAEPVLYAIILGVISGATGQQVDVEPEVFSYPGQTVNLRCAFINAAGNELTQVTWSYESKEGNRTNIAVFRPNNDPHYPDSPVKGRVSFSPSPPNMDSPSIQISDVRMTDDGNYICSISTFPAGNRQGTTSLVMLERVSNVTVTANSTDLVEFSSVSLFCSSSGSSLSFLWLNGSSEVTASDRVQLTDGNTTLTIVSVTRYDQGPFRCHVFNAVSNGTSAPINLSISFGPENIHLTKSPSQDYYVEGSDIILMCSAVSRPAALFNWFLNRVPLSDTGPELRLINIKEAQSGNYSCQAFNNKTMRNETSQPSVISVLTRVSNVIVTASITDLVEFSSVSLFCSSSGSSLSFLWLNGSSEVTASDRVQLTDGNTTLTIVSVTRYDQGPFRCHVFNPFSNGTSAPVNLSISFGPENINLTKSPSQDYYVEGSDIILMCSAVSRPAALFNWFLNRVPLSDTGPELRLINIKEDQSGNYSCQAFNNKTMRNETSQPSVISVLTRVSNVIVTASSTDLVEFSSVSLFCSSSGSSLSFLWLNGSSEVTASDRVQLTDGNTTLTIVSVTRYDQGPFRCHVFNPFSNGTSAPVNLSISFGPENINLTKSPSQDYYVEGSDIILMCSAVSRPAALFNWFLNRVPLSDTGPELRLINIKEDQSGNYSCQAFNNKTMRNETSQPSVISVLKPVVNASVTSSTNQPVEGNSFNLTCEAAGSVFAITWMKDGADLIQTENIIFYNENRVLSFQLLEKTDNGNYSCNISNPLSSVAAEYIMVVNWKHGCLSAGAIAAIVITICFIAAGGAAGGYCIYKKKNKKDPPPHNTELEEHTYENTSVVYEDIK